jgi:hypothetical protein
VDDHRINTGADSHLAIAGAIGSEVTDQDSQYLSH